MNLREYRKCREEINLRLEKFLSGKINQKKIKHILKLVRRENVSNEIKIITLVQLLKGISRFSIKKNNFQETNLLLAQLISSADSWQEVETFDAMLQLESDENLMNMIWTQRYVFRLHLNLEENNHLKRLSDLRQKGLSGVFDFLLGNIPATRTRRFPRRSRNRQVLAVA